MQRRSVKLMRGDQLTPDVIYRAKTQIIVWLDVGVGVRVRTDIRRLRTHLLGSIKLNLVQRHKLQSAALIK